MAIRMTRAQKHKDKTMGYNNPWDPTTSITVYFTQLDRFQVSLGNHGIATSKSKKTMAAGAQMWQSKMFMEDQMVAWENKTAAQQTWAVLQAYTSLRSGWNASSIPQQWQNNHDSKRQHFSPKKQQQPRKKENCRPCCLQCYRNNMTSRLQQ